MTKQYSQHYLVVSKGESGIDKDRKSRKTDNFSLPPEESGKVCYINHRFARSIWAPGLWQRPESLWRQESLKNCLAAASWNGLGITTVIVCLPATQLPVMGSLIVSGHRTKFESVDHGHSDCVLEASMAILTPFPGAFLQEVDRKRCFPLASYSETS